MREIESVYGLIDAYYEKNPHGHYFDHDTLKFFGERISEMRLLKQKETIMDISGEKHECYVLSSLQRKYPGGPKRKYTYFDVEYDGILPVWGTMWSFGDSADDYWLKEMGGIRKMSQCGFRIYENKEWGYFFGVDDCGYSFFEAHWEPLYKERGLLWHDPQAERRYQMTKRGYKKGKLGDKEYWFDGDKAVEEEY